MVISRKEKETNQQVLRRFNRIMQYLTVLNKAREKQEFVKEPNRSAIKRSAQRRSNMLKNREWY